MGKAQRVGILKSPTGIAGFDEITGGGLPSGRPTLVCGNAGCGKTLFAMEFLVRGALAHGEPGVFVAFEENEEDLRDNVKSLGFRLDRLVARRLLLIDQVRVERSEIEETGEYNLDGLFIRLAHAIDTIGAKRVVLDTIEALFAGFKNTAILRAELRRLFSWLKERGVTAVITAERGEGSLTRQGLEEYVSDCVILLDQRVEEQLATRRLRVVKYRGSAHGSNEYPFLIDEDGISILPVTSLGLDHAVSSQRLSVGVEALDQMLDGGLYRGSSVLVTGTAGTGKSTLAAHIAAAACSRGERCLYFAYEESPAQIVRNMRSVGIALQPFCDKGLLHIRSSRPTAHGLEMHLVAIHKSIEQLRPKLVVIDPVSTLIAAGNVHQTHSMLLRVVDFLKLRGITAVYTSIAEGGSSVEATNVSISSIIDTWLLLRQVELSGERNRTLFVLKSRGMNHSNQVREMLLTDKGITLRDAYLGASGVLTGSARLAQEARDREAELLQRDESLRHERLLVGRQKTLAAQLASLQAELSAIDGDLQQLRSHEQLRRTRGDGDRQDMAQSRSSRREAARQSNGQAARRQKGAARG
jgi:circadian clock protein KaiC